MAFDSQHITIGAAPTLISHSDGDDRAGKTVTISCTTNFYLGGPNVAPANGYPVSANRDIEIADYEGSLYACVDPANNNAPAYLLWAGV